MTAAQALLMRLQVVLVASYVLEGFQANVAHV